MEENDRTPKKEVYQSMKNNIKQYIHCSTIYPLMQTPARRGMREIATEFATELALTAELEVV